MSPLGASAPRASGAVVVVVLADRGEVAGLDARELAGRDGLPLPQLDNR
jgi:hypothetical protein